MSLLLPLERCLVNLEEDVDPSYLFIYMPRATALRWLKEQTGQDFDYDAKRWREWLEGAGLISRRNIPAEMLQILEDDFPPGYLRRDGDRERAVRKLREWTGQDFAFDAKQWREWLECNGTVLSGGKPAEPHAPADGGRDPGS